MQSLNNCKRQYSYITDFLFGICLWWTWIMLFVLSAKTTLKTKEHFWTAVSSKTKDLSIYYKYFNGTKYYRGHYWRILGEKKAAKIKTKFISQEYGILFNNSWHRNKNMKNWLWWFGQSRYFNFQIKWQLNSQYYYSEQSYPQFMDIHFSFQGHSYRQHSWFHLRVRNQVLKNTNSDSK